MLEETGLTVEIIGEKYESLADSNADVTVLHHPYVILCELVRDHYHNDLIYLCRIMGEAKINHNLRESEAIGFFGLDELDGMNVFPNFKALLKKVLESKK